MDKEKLLQIISKYDDLPKTIIENINKATTMDYVIVKYDVMLAAAWVRNELYFDKYYSKFIHVIKDNYLEEYGQFIFSITGEDILFPSIVINPNTYNIIAIMYYNNQFIYTPPKYKIINYKL